MSMSKPATVAIQITIPYLPGEGQEVKPGYRNTYQPTKPMTNQERAETDRLHAHIEEARQLEQLPIALVALLTIVILYIAFKLVTRLYDAKASGKA